jgi:hypothetical protein
MSCVDECEMFDGMDEMMSVFGPVKYMCVTKYAGK